MTRSRVSIRVIWRLPSHPVAWSVPRTRTRGSLALHPDLEAEQAYLDYAYECLEAARRRAAGLGSMVEVGRGGTEQARFERDVIWDTIVNRLRELELGDASLVFGRIDRATDNGDGQATPSTSGAWRCPTRARSRWWSTGGRRSPSPSTAPPAARRWGSPAAGTSPPRAASCSAIEDELFGDAAAARAVDGADGRRTTVGSSSRDAARCSRAIETARTGPPHRHRRHHPGRAGRDHPVRARPACSSSRAGPAPARPSSPCTAPPTSSTRTGSRSRARACSSSVPTGCSSATSSRCCRRSARPASSWSCSPTCSTEPVSGPRLRRPGDGADQGRRAHGRRCSRRRCATASVRCGRLAGRLRRPDAPRSRPNQSATIVADAAAPGAHHNAGRRFVERGVFDALAPLEPSRRRHGRRRPRPVRRTDEVRAALEWMWPVLTPAQLLHDLFGSQALLRSRRRQRPERRRARRAVPRALRVDRRRRLHERRRPAARRGARVARAAAAAAPARGGRRRGPHLRPHRRRRGPGPVADAAADARTSIAQRLDDRRRRHRPGHRRVGPRRLGRDRSPSCPTGKPARRAELTIGYRIPAPNMELAARVLRSRRPTSHRRVRSVRTARLRAS